MEIALYFEKDIWEWFQIIEKHTVVQIEHM
jgi:hypothetical protein